MPKHSDGGGADEEDSIYKKAMSVDLYYNVNLNKFTSDEKYFESEPDERICTFCNKRIWSYYLNEENKICCPKCHKSGIFPI